MLQYEAISFKIHLQMNSKTIESESFISEINLLESDVVTEVEFPIFPKDSQFWDFYDF